MASKYCGEDYITCPYNPSHRLPEGRFQTHLVRCRRHYQDLKYGQCIYNATHRVPEPELKYHHESCKDKYLLDRHLYIPENVDSERYPVNNLVIDTGETWDDEEVPTYDPSEYCKAKPILRKLDVAPESKRREFRMVERLRFAHLTNPPEEKNTEWTSRHPKDKSASFVDTNRQVNEDAPSHIVQTLKGTHGISEREAMEAGPSSSRSDSPTQSPQRPPKKGQDADGFQLVTNTRYGRGRGRGPHKGKK